MGDLVLSTERHIEASPDEVFLLFGAGVGGGWLFDAVCDRVRVGGAVTLTAPLFGAAGAPVEILGRIVAVRRPGRSAGRIDIEHDAPWHGRLSVRFAAENTGTRVRLVAQVGGAGMEWLMRRRGFAVPRPALAGSHPIGLLTSKSGPASVFATGTEKVAELAVDEVNADGGIGGEPVTLVVGDDATDPGVGALEAWRLVHAGCRAIMATTTSATFANAARELRDAGVLLVQTVMNEGGLGGELCVQLGERPADQLRAAAAPVMRESGGRSWFLAGNDYVWPRVIHTAARQVLDGAGGTVVGERFAPLGTRDFAPVIEEIRRSGAEIVLSSFVGADLVAFERQCHSGGLRSQSRSLALALDEPTRERIGDAAAAGMWGVAGYFESLPGQVNTAFLQRYRAKFGRFAPPLSSISESVYDAIHLYAAAAQRAEDPTSAARALWRGRAEFPRGQVLVDGPEAVGQQMFLAEAVPGGFRVVRSDQ